jgi:hypothetical protein
MSIIINISSKSNNNSTISHNSIKNDDNSSRNMNLNTKNSTNKSIINLPKHITTHSNNLNRITDKIPTISSEKIENKMRSSISWESNIEKFPTHPTDKRINFNSSLLSTGTNNKKNTSKNSSNKMMEILSQSNTFDKRNTLTYTEKNIFDEIEKLEEKCIDKMEYYIY